MASGSDQSEHDICVRLGLRIRKLREKRGWTQTDLAVYAGLGRPFISSVERGKKEPGLRSLQTFAGAFDMTISQLMRGI